MWLVGWPRGLVPRRLSDSGVSSRCRREPCCAWGLCEPMAPPTTLCPPRPPLRCVPPAPPTTLCPPAPHYAVSPLPPTTLCPPAPPLCCVPPHPPLRCVPPRPPLCCAPAGRPSAVLTGVGFLLGLRRHRSGYRRGTRREEKPPHPRLSRQLQHRGEVRLSAQQLLFGPQQTGWGP